MRIFVIVSVSVFLIGLSMFLFVTFNPPQPGISELQFPAISMDGSFSKLMHSGKQQVTRTSPRIDTAPEQSEAFEDSDDRDSTSDAPLPQTNSQTEEEEVIKMMVAQLHAEREELKRRNNQLYAEFAEAQRELNRVGAASDKASIDYEQLHQELESQLPPEPSEEDLHRFHTLVREAAQKWRAARKAELANPYGNRMNAIMDETGEIGRQIAAINRQIVELKSMLPSEN